MLVDHGRGAGHPGPSSLVDGRHDALRSSFMADARRAAAPRGARLRSMVVPSAHVEHFPIGVSNEEEDGWTTVVHRRRRSSLSRPVERRGGRLARPVPPELEGRCFNCLAWDHVAAACRASSHCLRCNEEGHRAHDCWRARRRRRRRWPPARRPLHPRLPVESGSEPTSDHMISGRSVSTGSEAPRPAVCISPSPPSSPAGCVGRRPSAGFVVIPRSVEIDEEEARLARALVATVGGCRPTVCDAQVAQYLVELYGIDLERFAVHKHSVEDFLVVFEVVADLECVLRRPAPPSPPFILVWKRWSRLARAQPLELRFRVLLVLSGIPDHAWSVDSAQRVLGSSCAKLEPTPETEARVDLKNFVLCPSRPHPT
ncbi:hypothetical protein BS78_02G176800 [Paspalum vaginatum]|nr:hypothetical protein BS78_02G176800 [Paspalum vaginatum]